ncbi:unnamed protein product [Dovyalis caffra]|uniref:UmuC domain-containing protein n=1 Tax=Dovyalis caffra TaxID=77055 RepID=A0AAV1RCW5_9ROSI|nr:unnamed protein product [Dovyalis caffra]
MEALVRSFQVNDVVWRAVGRSGSKNNMPNVFEKYDRNFLDASLNEACLDITEVCKERGMSGGEIAEELRKGVNEETGLTCSTGLLAKVLSAIPLFHCSLLPAWTGIFPFAQENGCLHG